MDHYSSSSSAGAHMLGYDPGAAYHQSQLSLSLAKPYDHHHDHHQMSSSFLQEGNTYFDQQPFQLKNSKYIFAAQELLNEFCSLGNSGINNIISPKKKHWEEGGSSSSPSLYGMDMIELQKRKTKLLSMLEEVYKKYKRYCEQMRAVVSSFEAAAGAGSATVYSTLASKAMSRHFRCLRDGIMDQIRATRMAMGEKDVIAPGTTKGETPRLKKLEQCLRQQKVFQQAGIVDSQPWRPQRGLPERSVSVLRAWLFEHFLHPYPSDVDKHILARQTGLSRSQVSNWFINARVRLWKPMVEEMYLEELKEDTTNNNVENPNSTNINHQQHDRKPGPDQLMNIGNPDHHLSGSLSSIINPNPNFGVVDMDFGSYVAPTHHTSNVSLTLGLQQMEGQYGLLDEGGQGLPYRNLMEAQLLHDLAG